MTTQSENTHDGKISIEINGQIVKFDPKPLAKFLLKFGKDTSNLIKDSLVNAIGVYSQNAFDETDTDTEQIGWNIRNMTELYNLLSCYSNTAEFFKKEE